MNIELNLIESISISRHTTQILFMQISLRLGSKWIKYTILLNDESFYSIVGVQTYL